MLDLLLLALAWAAGTSLTFLIKLKLNLEERLAWGAPIGLLLAAWSGFLAALLGGIVAGTATVMLLCAVIAAIVLRKHRPTIRLEWADFTKRTKKLENAPFIAMIVLFAIGFGYIYQFQNLPQTEAGL